MQQKTATRFACLGKRCLSRLASAFTVPMFSCFWRCWQRRSCSAVSASVTFPRPAFRGVPLSQCLALRQRDRITIQQPLRLRFFLQAFGFASSDAQLLRSASHGSTFTEESGCTFQ